MYSGGIPSSILSVSPWMVFYTIIAPYSIGISCILDEVKKCTGFYHFGGGWVGGGGGGKRRGPRIPYFGVRGEYMYSGRILSVFYRITEYAEYGQNTDHVFWWTEYLVFFTYSVYSLLVDRIPYSGKKAEYVENT